MGKRSRKSEASSQKLNTTQLLYLRVAFADIRDGGVGAIYGDGGTVQALIRRGFAEFVDGKYYITRAGLARAKKKADAIAYTTSGIAPHPSLLEDLA